MAWLTNWNYRKSITISNTGSTLSDYQVLSTIDTASLVTAGKMRTDCGDIRFADTDGSTLLNYWIESGCNTSSTKIWVKVPSVPTSKTIYLYYGNSSATSISNGTNTFEFFDDFNRADGSVGNGWTSYDGTWSILSNTLKSISTPGGYSNLYKPYFGDKNLMISGMGNLSGGEREYFLIKANTASSEPTVGLGIVLDNYADTIKIWDGVSVASTPFTIIDNIWYNFELTIKNDYSMDAYVWISSGTKPVSPTVSKAAFTPSSNGNNFRLNTNSGGTKTNYWENIRARKYATTEPTATLGSEQTPPNITATSMIITPSETPCRVGICTVSVDVTWTNTGGSAGIFTPSITFDGTPVVVTPPLNPVSVDPSGIATQSFIISGLSAGIRSICPDPN